MYFNILKSSEDEKRLWDSTVGDQWNLRPKFGLVKGLDRAHKQGLYPGKLVL